MSLRLRLVLVIVALVTLVAAALAVLHLDTLINSLSEDALQRSDLVSQQVKSFVIDLVNRESAQYAPPSSLEESVALWNQILTSQPDISRMLKMMAASQGVVEINVAGRTGQILASSVDSRVGGNLDSLPTLRSWRSLPLNRRLLDLFGRKPDYQITVPLGVNGQEFFTVQVVTSTVLLSTLLMPEVQWVAIVSLSALLASLLVTAVATNWLLRPLRRLEQIIDRIAQGKFGRAEKPPGLAKEFAAVESKLNLLGEQFRGAREEASEMQHNLDQLLERMESHLDVASRLTAISRITSSVAHEIKNPLNAIALHLDLLRERIGGPEEDMKGEIDVLSKEVRRLDRVVKTFLDFSRPVEVRLEEVDLAALAREVSELMIPQARLSKIDLRFDPSRNGDAPRGDAFMRGDADMLKQAILNLVTNALDAMKEGGELRLSVARAGEIVSLEVADNGPGIPPELRNKVFQLYFTTKPKGSGIGLAMTYRAVQLHNGTIDFTSEDGRGTTFRLQFPALVGHA